MKGNVNILKNRAEVVVKLTELIQNVCNEKITEHGAFNIAVSGGSLVGLLKDCLPNVKTDFTKWRVFFCDERIVPYDSPDSTYGQYIKHLNELNLKDDQFVKIKEGVSAEEAAKDYIEKISKYLVCKNIPIFDMLLLGMGPDGHTCSLFPGHNLLEENDKWVAAITDSPKPPPSRITITFPIINNASYCVFPICGKEKADILKRVIKDQEDLPATKVQPISGNLVWILDECAGEFLKNNI